MKLIRVIAVSVIVSSLGLAAAQSKTLREAGTPSSFPPASYKGKQFVDSRGCAYIRAGIDGAVNWVPRVSRSRQVVCGLKPTFGAGEQVAAVAPKRSNVVQIVPKQLPAEETAQKPAPKAVTKVAKPVVQPAPQKQATAPRRVAQTKPVVITPKPVQRAAAPQVRRVNPAPQQIARTPAAKPVRKVAAPVRAPQQVTRQATCTNFTGISAQYAGRGEGVRCGPQAQPVTAMSVTRQPAQVVRNGRPVTVQRRVVKQAPAPQPRVVVQQQPRTATVIKRNRATGVINAPGTTKVVPRHVYQQQQASNVSNKAPNGYRKAWSDDRLNTKRAHMKVNGIRQSDLVWTRTVPRKLYLKGSGKVVNNLFPDLRYPYTSMADQNKAMGLTTSSRSAAPVAQPRKQAKTQASTSGRYVQVGTFGQPANANRAAARLQASGLPIRMSQLNRSGKNYRVVLVGPLASNQLSGALSKARKAGFSDAFVR